MFCWTLNLSGGTERYHHAAVVVENTVYSFKSGVPNLSDPGNKAPIDVNIFDIVSLRWMKLPPVTPGRGEHHLNVPSSRYGHSAVLIGDVMYIWGGYPYCNVLYAFDVDSHRWFKPKVSGTVPEVRENHSACVSGKVMYVHGGRTLMTGCTNDIYKFDTTTMVWSLIHTRGTPPPASECHSATIIGTKMFVFGGDGHQDHNIRVFDTQNNLWLSTPPACLSEGHEAHSTFTYNGELYIFGGCYWDQTFNDLWRFIPETFSWKKVGSKGKGPPKMYGMCCCLVGDRILLLGGGNTHILDLSPSLKMLCKQSVLQYGLEQSELRHDIRRELAAMTTNVNRRN